MGMLALLSGLVPLAVWVLMQAPGEDWWLGAALTYAPKIQWIALPLGGIIVAAAARCWRVVLICVGSAAFALFVIAGYQINRPPPVPTDRPVIRVATWNIYGWTREYEVVRDRILSWDCDVVCLQEAGRPRFYRLLPGYDSVYVADMRIFVRGTVLHHEAPSDPITKRPRMLLAEVETDAGRFTVVNVHIPREERQQQTPRELRPFIEYVRKSVDIRDAKFGQLLDTIPATGPVVVAGDMNTPPASRYHGLVANRLTDTFTVAGSGFGHTFAWQRKLPLLRIDYVWTGGGVTPLRHTVLPHGTSDHRPIVTELALPAGDPPG